MGCAAVVLVPALVIAVLHRHSGWPRAAAERVEPLASSSAAAAGAARDGDRGPPSPDRIVLDLNRGSFVVRAGRPGDALRLEGRVRARAASSCEESFESYGEVGWIYRVSLDQKGFGIRPFVIDGEP